MKGSVQDFKGKRSKNYKRLSKWMTWGTVASLLTLVGFHFSLQYHVLIGEIIFGTCTLIIIVFMVWLLPQLRKVTPGEHFINIRLSK